MKKISKILSVLLTLTIIFSYTITSNAATKIKSNYTGLTYTNQSQFDNTKILNGIDVSEHNGTIDFKKAKMDGIDFVFVRVGYTGYTKSRFSLNYDANYRKNITDAINAGMQVGVYWYSQALNTDEAKKEAEKMLSAIKDYNITLPVVMDYEFAGVSTGRLDSAKLSKTTMTKNATAFLSRVELDGYEPCIYANRSFLNDHVDGATLGKTYSIWVAEYNTSTSFNGEFDYWQYSSKGIVDGISGKTDVNFWYYSNSFESLSNKGYTGSAITPNPTIKYNDTTLIAKQDYKLYYYDNVNIGVARIVAKGINDYAGKSWRYSFKIVPFKPKDLKVTSKKYNSLSLSWQSSAGANKYMIKCTDTSTGKATYAYSSTTDVTITGLNGFTDYKISVKAGGSDKYTNTVYGSYCPSIQETTAAPAVTGISVKARGTNYITLKWNKMAGANGYRIYKYDPSSKKYAFYVDLPSESTLSYKISNLSPGKDYSFKVSAYTVENSKKYIGSFGTAFNTATKPVTAKIISLSAPKTKKITVKFSKVTDCTGYQIQWSTVKDFSSKTKYANVGYAKTSTISKTIPTAKSKATYYVRVRAYKTSKDGVKAFGAWSSPKSIKSR